MADQPENYTSTIMATVVALWVMSLEHGFGGDVLDTPSCGGTTGLSFSPQYALLSITNDLSRNVRMLMLTLDNARSGSDN